MTEPREETLRKKREYMKGYTARNRAELSAKKKAWRNKNRSRAIATQKKWYRSHREEILRKQRNPEYRFNVYKSRAKRLGLGFDLSKADFLVLLSASCHYCGQFGDGTVDRVDSSVGYVAGNVVSCCWRCNISKNKFSAEDFVKMCKEVAKYHDSKCSSYKQ